MEKAERDLILRQGITLPETPRDRRERAALEEEIAAMPLRGRPLSPRLLNFRPSAEAYLAASRGPLVYMLRLHDIEVRIAELGQVLADRWRSLALERRGDAAGFAEHWYEVAATVDFDELNDVIERHNRWYPIEARLPMDPRTGDFALVNGRDYRLRPLDAGWVLERYPPELARALAEAA